MALLKSVLDVKDVDYYEYRDNIYYNKYKYRLRIKVYGSDQLRFFNYTTFDALYKRLESFNDKAKQRGFYYGRAYDLELVKKNRVLIEKLISVRDDHIANKDPDNRIRIDYLATLILWYKRLLHSAIPSVADPVSNRCNTSK